MIGDPPFDAGGVKLMESWLLPTMAVPIVGASGTAMPLPDSAIVTGLVVAPLRLSDAENAPAVDGLKVRDMLHVAPAASAAPLHVDVRENAAAFAPVNVSTSADVLPLPVLVTVIVRGADAVAMALGPKSTLAGDADSTPCPGVTLTVVEAILGNTRFLAATVHVSATPLVNPLKVIGDAVAVAVAVLAPAVQVTV